MSEFHFLRPYWLLLLIPVLTVFLLHWRAVRGGAAWRGVIDPALLPFLLEQRPQATGRRALLLLLAGGLIATIALAGPAWEKLPSPVQRKLDLQLVLFDLSLSMYAQDIKPSRLVRARYKLQDFLEQREEGQTALIAYAGDAFVVTPFTDDRGTVLNQVRALDPSLMPAPGSNLPAALHEAERLLQQQPGTRARVLLITDEVRSDQIESARRWSARMDMPLHILAAGTRSGAPIPLPDGDFARDGMGKLVTPGVNVTALRSLARDTGGLFQTMRADRADIEALLAAAETWAPETESAGDRQADTYRDAGPWLALLLLPLAAFAFRRGILLVVPVVLLTESPEVRAADWQALWRNNDQRGLEAFREEQYDTASELFRDPDWQASTHYRAGRYREAAEIWAQQGDIQAQYNRGNALAQSGDLEAALEAYDHALAQDPDHADARANRALVEQLLQERQESSQNASDQPRESDEERDGEDEQDASSGGGSNPPEDATEDSDASDPRDGASQQAQGAQQQADDPAERQAEESREADAAKPETSEAASDQESTGQSAMSAQAGENDQALEQWLRRIPDDPSALLRRKFLWQYQQRANQPGGANGKDEVYW